MALPQARRRQGGSGFTLTELMVVIAIVGIVSAVAAPSFLKSMRAGHSARGARGIVEVMRYARQEALTRNRAMRVQMFPATTGSVGGSVTVVAGDGSTCSSTFPNGALGAVGTLTYVATEGGSDVGFDKLTVGGSAVTTGDFCLKASGELYLLPSKVLTDGAILEVVTISGSLRNNIRTVTLGANGSARVK